MRLTYKDAVGGALALIAVLVALDLTNAWGWPLLGDYRAGVIALAVIGFGMCAWASDYSTIGRTDPLVVIAGMLGIAALALLVAGLIWATAQLMVWFAIVIVSLWLVSTVRHLIAHARPTPARPALS